MATTKREVPEPRVAMMKRPAPEAARGDDEADAGGGEKSICHLWLKKNNHMHHGSIDAMPHGGRQLLWYRFRQ